MDFLKKTWNLEATKKRLLDLTTAKCKSIYSKRQFFLKSDRLEENIYNVYTKLRLKFITVKSTSAISKENSSGKMV